MANLIVRNISEEVAEALEERANQMGVSLEVAHRLLLEQILICPKKKSFLDVLKEMPDIGRDSDLERIQDTITLAVFD